MMNQIRYLLLIVLIGELFSQGNFQILNIPPSTRLLALSNSGHTINDITNSYNPASIQTNKQNINIHSHLYPADIIYIKTEMIFPVNKTIYSFEYANLNYGEFKDANTDYSFNSSEFLFKGSIKMQLFNRFAIGGSLGYGINKISNEFSHALFVSLGVRTQMDNPRLGLGISINNIGKIINNFNNIEETLPTSISLSTFYQPTYFPGILYFDFYQQKNIDQLQIKLGLEIEIINNLVLRLGNNSNTIDILDSYSSYLAGLSGGVGILSEKWNIDIGFYNLETAGVISSISLVYKK